MKLNNIAIIVDGPTEQGSLRTKFEMKYFDCPEIRMGPGNGIDFTSKGYAKGVLPTVIYLLNSNIRAIILIPDLEKRKVTVSKFAHELKSELIKLLLTQTSFKEESLKEVINVCPPDIMFENWIVCDVKGIKENNKLIKENAIQLKFDGKNGTSELQKLMTEKYKKTVHAKILYKKTKDEESILNSPSYKDFVENLEKLINKHCQ